MFKNCCGCANNKTKRRSSEDNENEEETKEKEVDNKTGSPLDTTNEPAREIAQNVKDQNVANANNAGPDPTSEKVKDVKPSSTAEPEAVPDIVQRKTSLKKPKPRLSISTEVRIIPTNFPEDLEFDTGEEEPENETKEGAEGEEEEEEEEEIEDRKISVKNIDGKVIKRSSAGSGESPTKPSQSGVAERTISPLSDEVFVTSEQGGLELPLHNLGVKMDRIPLQTLGCKMDAPPSPRGQTPTPHPVKRGSLPPGPEDWIPDDDDDDDEKGGPKKPTAKSVPIPPSLEAWLAQEDDETGGTQEPPATPVSQHLL